MRKSLYAVFALFLIVSCGQTNKKQDEKEPQEKSKKEDIVETLPSADYSTLLTDYSCDMEIAELAKVLDVPESDLSIPKQASPRGCSFDLKGFGENKIGDQSRLYWKTSKNSKAGNKKEIETYFKNQEELPDNVSMGMGIQLAETKDCYIAFQPAHGRVIIINENYDNMFLLSYGRMSAATTRTPDQQDELKIKMTKLANYLLKKHKK